MEFKKSVSSVKRVLLTNPEMHMRAREENFGRNMITNNLEININKIKFYFYSSSHFSCTLLCNFKYNVE